MLRNLVAATLWACPLLAFQVHAETILGIREADGHLISFDSEAPGAITGDRALTGLPDGTQLSAIDFNAATRAVYAVVRGPATGQCQLYRLDTAAAAVTPIGNNRFRCNIVSDIDINPFDNNSRFIGGVSVFDVNIDGAVVQLPDVVAVRRADAAYPATGDFSSGSTPDVRDTAYDHNTVVASAGQTSLFAIDETAHTLVRVGADTSPIEPPTTLTTIGTGLGAGVGGGPLDISGASGIAYMFDYDFGPGVGSHGKLYTVDLVSGVATLVGKVGTESLNLLGMTVIPNDVPLSPMSGGSGGGGGAFAPGLLAGLSCLLGLRRRRRARR
ncbi:MAG: DUF4394 domain-containing protein [Nevskia sp.]|nr:DUF4394 domain-containing protein [Nevskia sp.]